MYDCCDLFYLYISMHKCVYYISQVQNSRLVRVFSQQGFTSNSAGKESPCNAGDSGLIPGSGRSPGEGNRYPLQYSDLENSMDYSPWSHTQRVRNDWATSTFTFTQYFKKYFTLLFCCLVVSQEKLDVVLAFIPVLSKYDIFSLWLFPGFITDF